jgi:hypothetical protein
MPVPSIFGAATQDGANSHTVALAHDGIPGFTLAGGSRNYVLAGSAAGTSIGRQNIRQAPPRTANIFGLTLIRTFRRFVAMAKPGQSLLL